jgi:hypothetical protein
MTLEEIVRLADWTKAGDIDGCDVTRCVGNAEKYACIGKETWFFCKTHFVDYLRECDRIYNDPLNLLGREK